MFDKHIFLIILFLSASGCTKKLDIKPDNSLAVPNSTADYQALLDNTGIMNILYPVLGEIAADNYYITDTRYNVLQIPYEKNAYIWNKEIFSDLDQPFDWSFAYQRLAVCNIVLDGLSKLKIQQDTAFKNAKGIALFFRAFNYYSLAQIFCPSYDSVNAKTDLGLPLRTGIDLDKVYQRSTLQQTYDLILNDLQEAADLLPNVTTYKTRPSKATVQALLSRIYLVAGDYEQALRHADTSLQLYHTLLDYNEVDSSLSAPFPIYNNEVLLHVTLANSQALSISNANIDSILYGSYESYDLRKKLFFKKQMSGMVTYRGSYGGSTGAAFTGLSVDEVYLNRAECYAWKGQVQSAMNDLNVLLKTRWAKGHFVPFMAGDQQTALEIILNERRKELIFRGVRWPDLRRLNRKPHFEKTLRRMVNGTIYTLEPNSLRYVYPIPPYEISVSGIQQNPR